MNAIGPGGVVGILGGGQLGRMLALAAARLGLRVEIYAPAGDAPAEAVSARRAIGSADYLQGVEEFTRRCDVVTYEFENVPLAAAEAVASAGVLRPGPRALEVSQDRLTEKTFLRGLGLGVAEFHPVDSLADLAAAAAALGGDGVLKTRRLGYDGRGQARIAPGADLGAAFAAIGAAPAILEARIDFVREISVIAARGLDGENAAYDPAENLHEGGVLRRSVVPAASTPSVVAAAKDAARRILTALDYVGVVGVEFFELSDGRLLVNEFAPRVHNTGHWTLEACVISQFEQHIRAICCWPLGDPARHSDAEMTNLLGHEADDWAGLAAEPGAAIHLYGKAEARAGRKMGHITRLLGPRSQTEG